MLAFKIVLYILTIATIFFFAFWELKLRRQLTDEALEKQQETVSDYCATFYGIRKEIRRERLLNRLPPEALFKYKVIAGLKFLFAVVLAIEVIILQR